VEFICIGLFTQYARSADLVCIAKTLPSQPVYVKLIRIPDCGVMLSLTVNQSIKIYFLRNKKYYNVLHAIAQKAAREALRSLNWPPKQTKEHKYEYK